MVRPNVKITRNASITESARTGTDFTKLPSYQYRHVNWSDLKGMEITGPSLKGPRVRATPTLKDGEFSNVPETRANYQPHIYNFSSRQERRGAAREVKEVQHLKSGIEDWQNVTEVNLSYQELGDVYQVQMLNSTLKKLLRCESLVLIDNRITDLASYTFPCVGTLNVSLNMLSSFEQLPKCPKLTTLNLVGNKITDLTHCAVLKGVVVLKIKGNPLVWTLSNYRQRLFDSVPSLAEIDGLNRAEVKALAEDPL